MAKKFSIYLAAFAAIALEFLQRALLPACRAQAQDTLSAPRASRPTREC